SALYAMGISMLGKVWRDMPISMLILLAGLNSIEHEQYDAAETMGANSFKKFFYITIPSILPAVGTVILMRSIEMWKEFIFPFILAPSFPLLGTYIESLYRWRHPERAAVISLVLLFCVIISSFLSYGFIKVLRRCIVRI
ncbi:MAG: ABC transporter permease subunit, partial [Elusimicrobiota bacterium]